jgi:hypothetical protein
MGDRIVLGKVGIEGLLACRLHGIVEHPLIEHRQGARQAAQHRIDVGVGSVGEGGGGGREDLAGGEQLPMGLANDQDLPGAVCRIGNGACLGRPAQGRGGESAPASSV